jgi:hypothetical protein
MPSDVEALVLSEQCPSQLHPIERAGSRQAQINVCHYKPSQALYKIQLAYSLHTYRSSSVTPGATLLKLLVRQGIGTG